MEPEDQPYNTVCCYPFMKCLFAIKEMWVILISTSLGLCYLASSLAMMFVLVPLNLMLTYGTQIKHFDLLINIGFMLSAFTNFVTSIILLSLTKKQKYLCRILCNKICCCNCHHE